VGEVRADEQLVEERERHGEVRVDMEPVPGLVAHPPAGRGHRGEAHQEEEPEAHHRPQDVRVARHEVQRLGHDVLAVAEGPAGQRQDGVPADQPDRREADPAVGPREPVGSDRLVQPRATGHEDDADEREVGAHQRGELAGGGERAAQGVELVEATVADPHEEDQHGVAGNERDHVDRAQPPLARERHAARSGGGHGCHGRPVSDVGLRAA
jgi:hypothetical protein